MRNITKTVEINQNQIEITEKHKKNNMKYESIKNQTQPNINESH
jgi:hypothetical protein